MPIALCPDQEKDCFSGQTLVEDDRVVAIYHGTEAGNAIATASDPLLIDWQKHPDNPVIPMVDVDDDGYPYRVFDPCIWKASDGYYALSGVFKAGVRRVYSVGLDHLFRWVDRINSAHTGSLCVGNSSPAPGRA